MNILLTFDSGYAPHASVVMESIIRHCPEKLDFLDTLCSFGYRYNKKNEGAL